MGFLKCCPSGPFVDNFVMQSSVCLINTRPQADIELKNIPGNGANKVGYNTLKPYLVELLNRLLSSILEIIPQLNKSCT